MSHDEAKTLIALLFIPIICFVFSLCFWQSLFRELDYFEIKYTQKTKRRALLIIFGNLTSLIMFLYVVSALLRLA